MHVTKYEILLTLSYNINKQRIYPLLSALLVGIIQTGNIFLS